MSDQPITPISHPFTAVMSPPGSKSLTNRALVLAALADGVSTLTNLLFADDTLVMLDGLGKLGFHLNIDRAANTVQVHGNGGKIPRESAEIFCGNSGTTIRFLTALCALGKGEFILDGIPRMRQRPIGPLVQILRNMAARIEFPVTQDFPPVRVIAHGLAGGILSFGAEQSSQFLSAALMVSPFTRHETMVDLASGQTSWPYVSMTMRLMDEFGVTCELMRDPKTHEPRRIIVPQGTYRGRQYAIEPDASNATYFLTAAAIHPGSKITIAGLGKHSLQGDVAFAEVLRKMGAEVTVAENQVTITGGTKLAGVDVDLSNMPDTAQTLAVAALFAHDRTTIRGLHTLRFKETDRLAALSAELSKLGAQVSVEDDVLIIDPPETLRPAAIDTYDDHRMAMSFALAGTKSPGIVIKDSQCVAKTYPEFFDDLAKVLTSAK
jgi:3-phosphoshikimate 1-carboxyvinyltransferase